MKNLIDFMPPSWPVIRVLNLLVGALCVVTAFMAETQWIAMIDAAVAGISFSSYVWIGRIMKLQALQSLLEYQQKQINEAMGKR